mmetsp:Transcript_20215/g.30275  ORF Transcript_20215/g.30275 Transcript_20215/m.30275 type:complete len:167 (-) Transcript_20215:241-741(-)
MGRRFRPPPPAPSKPRMECTLQEHLANVKEQQESKSASAKLAEWEKNNSQGENDLDGPVLSEAQRTTPAGPAMPEKGKKKKKDKEHDKKKKKRNKKKEKKTKDKDKKKKKKKKTSSSSSSSSSSGESGSDSTSKVAKKRKFEQAAKASKQGWKISSFLKAGDSASS